MALKKQGVPRIKVCPTCRMRVAEDTECPFCTTTLTHEPAVPEETEKYVWNKYFVRHLLKHGWFSLLCLVVVVWRYLAVLPPFNAYHLLVWAFLLVSLGLFLFHRPLTRGGSWAFTEEHLTFRVTLGSIVCGVGRLCWLLAFFVCDM